MFFPSFFMNICVFREYCFIFADVITTIVNLFKKIRVMKRLFTLVALTAALLVPSVATAQRIPAKASMRLSQFKAPASAPSTRVS